MKEKQTNTKNPIVIAASQFAKGNKDYLNPEDFSTWSFSTGSLTLDLAMRGGIHSGVTVLGGASKGGKTSSLLEFVSRALETGENYAIYYDAEGRVTKEMLDRVKFKYCLEEEDWGPGICLFKWPKNHEFVLNQMLNVIETNKELPKSERKRFIFVVDSVDALVEKADEEKAAGELNKMASTASILSRFFAKSNMVLNKLGHCACFVKQVREKIKGNYDKAKPNESIEVGGGHSLTHYANYILEFKGRTKNKKIIEGGKVIGHKCTIDLKKSQKCDINVEVIYPVKYIDGEKGEGRVWMEYEIYELLLVWGFLEKKGAWLNFDEASLLELEAIYPNIREEKFQGANKFVAFLEENNDITKFFYEKFTNLLSDN